MPGALLGLLSLALTLLAGRAAAYLVGERRPYVGASVGVAFLVLGLYTFGRLTQSLVLATALTAAAAAAVLAVAWSRGPRAPAAAYSAPPLGALGRLGVALVLFLGGYCIFQGFWWDEYSCHFPIAAGLARGVVPAEHPLFPGEYFRYHYAFDLLAGAVRALTGMNVGLALDVVSLGLLGLLLGIARDLGATLGGQRGARLMPVLLPVATGTLLFLLYTDNGSIQVHWDALPQRWLQSVPPPTISNFFQHPQAMGMPLALAVAMLFDRPLDDPLRTRRSALAAVVMSALSLSQIVFFGTMGLILGLTTLGLAVRAKKKHQVLIDGALLFCSLVGAVLIGGFLAPGPSAQSMLRFGQSMFTDPPGLVVLYHLVVFGLPLLALPFAVAHVAKRPDPLRLTLTTAAVFGFMVPHFVTYARSWDIVKFLGVGAFFANVLFADVLSRWPKPGLRWRGGVIGALVLTSTLSGWVFLLRMGVLDGQLGIPPMHFPPPSKVGQIVGERLDELIDAEDMVFSSNIEFGSAAGIPTPGFDWRQVGQGFMLDRERSVRLAGLKSKARRNLDPAALKGLDVQWMVLAPGDIGGLDATGKQRLEDPTRFRFVERVKAAGQTRSIYEILPGAFEN